MAAAFNRHPAADGGAKLDGDAPSAEKARKVRLIEAMEELCELMETGQAPERATLLEKYTDVADELADCLDNLDFVQNVAPQLAGDPERPAAAPTRTLGQQMSLGDFRIVRELGRGGMGVVYEALQLSIGRSVALKVLPFAAMLDKQQLVRFKIEARAAGTLDHPNIVTVYSVGTERGVHYYAMQLVEGQSLAKWITDLRQSLVTTTDAAEPADGRTITYAGKGVHSPPTEPMQTPRTGPDADTHRDARVSLSTIPEFNTQEYYRSVVRLGIQAAHALEHAHQHGIVHRDVKPGNLLVDAKGNLWVTDFGLARIEADAGMSKTGDLLGTLRYMSPEQISGQRVVLDSRTDIYSLGVTLYELLTLQPAFGEMDRQKLLRQVTELDPRPLCQVNRAIPKDLETIVLKATSKDAADRYAKADDFAGDLRRFLEDRPIRARPPSMAKKLSKWTHRNQGLVATVAASMLVALGLIFIFLWQQSSQAHIASANQAALRKTAESNLYVAQMRLAHEEWKDGNVANAHLILESHIPDPGETDLRRWEWYYLDSLCHKEVATLAGHRGRVNGLAWSPNGQRLLSASSDKTVRVWDVNTRKQTVMILGHQKSVDWVAWSPGGRRIFSHSESEAVRLWDSASGKSLGSMSADMPARKVALSHDGSRIVTTHDHDLVKTWDAADDRELHRWQARLYRGPIARGSIAFTTKLLVSGEWWPGHIDILDATTGEFLHRKTTLLHGISAMAFSPDGSRFVTGSRDGQVKLWEPSSCTELLTIQGHDAEINGIAWRFDGQQWVTVGDDGKIKVWDASTLLSAGPVGNIRAFSGGPDAVDPRLERVRDLLVMDAIY